MICSNCHKTIEDSCVFCTYCGVRLGISPSPEKLPRGSTVGGRHTICSAHSSDKASITYIAQDAVSGEAFKISEFFPRDCAQRDASVSVRVTVRHGARQGDYEYGMSRFIGAAKRLGAISCFEENGTVYAVRDISADKSFAEAIDEDATAPIYDPWTAESSGESETDDVGASKNKGRGAKIIALAVVSGVIVLVGICTGIFFAVKRLNEASRRDEAYAETRENAGGAEEKAKTTAATEKAPELVKMPSVLGMEYGEAVAALKALGIAADVRFEIGDEHPEGTVFSQSVAAGTAIEKGVTVALTVMKAPQTQPVSDAAYFTFAFASSTLADEGEYSYGAQNAMYNDSTCWAEGADGYGVGEWIRFDLPQEQRLSGIKLINGYSGTQRQYEHNGKISSVRLDFSDGQSVTVDLNVYESSKRKTVQYISLNTPVVTDYVVLTILDVEPGECSDTCLTYVAPF